MKPKRLVVLESPYMGGTRQNIAYARRSLRDSLLRSEAPIASHLLYAQDGVLDDAVPDQRVLGMTSGWAWMGVADAVVVYTDLGISRGMQEGIDTAKKLGKVIEYREIGK